MPIGRERIKQTFECDDHLSAEIELHFSLLVLVARVGFERENKWTTYLFSQVSLIFTWSRRSTSERFTHYFSFSLPRWTWQWVSSSIAVVFLMSPHSVSCSFINVTQRRIQATQICSRWSTQSSATSINRQKQFTAFLERELLFERTNRVDRNSDRRNTRTDEGGGERGWTSVLWEEAVIGLLITAWWTVLHSKRRQTIRLRIVPGRYMCPLRQS